MSMSSPGGAWDLCAGRRGQMKKKGNGLQGCLMGEKAFCPDGQGSGALPRVTRPHGGAGGPSWNGT